MKKVIKFVYLIILLTACSAGAKKNEAVSERVANPAILYDTYRNEQHNYSIDYPDFLIPQGEAANRDGQKFSSEDGVNEMLVFFEYKMDDWGDFMDLERAYYYDRDKTGSLKNKLYGNYYVLSYEKNKKLFRQLTVEAHDAYITLILEFDKSERELLENVFEHVSESLNIFAPETEDEAIIMLMSFLDNCWWEKNFNSLLRDDDKKLAKYINKEFGVQRIYSPGTVPILSNRDENYGFTEFDDFNYEPIHGGEYVFDALKDNVNICALKDPIVAYYLRNSELPHVVINTETLESKQLESPWPDAEIISLYVLNENNSPRVFYFALLADGRLYLICFDDSICNA